MKISRRRFLGLSAAAGGGAALGVLGRGLAPHEAEIRQGRTESRVSSSIPFTGAQPAGIVTPQQKYLHFAAFDLTADRIEDIRAVLVAWTDAAASMAAGAQIASRPGGVSHAPPDSGETQGLGPARLTLTFGFGPGLFGTRINDRFDLASYRPAALVDLPIFRGDQLERERCGGDVCVQACADDPQVAFHAIRQLSAIGRGAVVVRWMQQGFRGGRGEAPLAGRNLLGFKDGTNNLEPSSARHMAANVWVGFEDEPAWMRGGTYMVVRRIRMRLEHWDSVSLSEQERTFGRRKMAGAPLNGHIESDPIDPHKLPADCHIIQANPRNPRSEAERILRRSYSFADGIDSKFGELDGGLFFVCFQRDPRRQFIPIQTRLSEHDHLGEYVFHTGGGIFAIPPGIHEGEYIGQMLLEAV
jgi:deferrochelatase/peroxidase EfeB